MTLSIWWTRNYFHQQWAVTALAKGLGESKRNTAGDWLADLAHYFVSERQENSWDEWLGQYVCELVLGRHFDSLEITRLHLFIHILHGDFHVTHFP